MDLHSALHNPQSAIPTVSVVIASHRPDFLEALIQALQRQTIPLATFEIIPVCDYPIVSFQEKFPRITFLYVNDKSISAKRNAGVKTAQAKTIAFIDDDCIPAPDWIESGMRYLDDHPSSAAVEGLTTIENSSYAPPSLREYRRLEKPGFRTNNIFYRTASFLKAGGFDERFTVQREDIDLAFSVLDNSETIDSDTAVRVMHRVRPGEPWDLLKNCINRRFDPLLFKKHPARYREHIRSPFPGSLLMLLGFHLAAALVPWIGIPFGLAACLADLAAVSAVAARRSGGKTSLKIFGYEWISCAAAPLLLAGALIHGSLRFRKFLLV
jgi:GT2 family glycosyltransferase